MGGAGCHSSDGWSWTWSTSTSGPCGSISRSSSRRCRRFCEDREPRDDESSANRGDVMSNATLGILGEFWAFLRMRKKWWLAPVVMMIVLLGALIFFTQGSAVAPFIYTIF